MLFDFQSKTPVSIICMLACNQTPLFVYTNPKKTENTVYLSTFTNLLWYHTVMQTLLLSVLIGFGS